LSLDTENRRQDVVAIVDEFEAIATERLVWERYWRDIAKYTLPQIDSFDRMIAYSPNAAIGAVVGTPAAAKQSKNIYDMTSLWGVERLTAGLLSLKTPESSYWHDNSVDSDFKHETSHDEKIALERLRDYQFSVRSNPKTGFWSNHKAAMKSMCAFGDGWLFVEETHGQRTPYRYEYLPLPDVFPALGPDGQPNRMFFLRQWSFAQVMQKWPDLKFKTVVDKANDPQQRHHTIAVLQAVKPRSDKDRVGMGTKTGAFASYFCFPDENYMIGEGGYYEFPFVRYAWGNNGIKPYCEGPVALALGEIKSLQEMSKNELLASQQLVQPAYATAGKNFQRLNFNSGATNPGLITPDGNQLFAPLNSGVRPDFAQAIMEYRRTSVREMLYLNLWQILVNDPQKTATEAMLIAQEKGEMFGPVGISMNEGLSMLCDREIGILARKGAFRPGSPLAMPESLGGRNVAPEFTSPLDRLRKMGGLVGMQRVIEIAGQLAQAGKMGAMDRIDEDEVLEHAQHVLGAPIKMLRKKEEANAATAQRNQAAGQMAAVETAKTGAEALKAGGEGAAALATGAEQAAASPQLQNILQGLQGMQGVAA
jgi:hypothetical protein